MTLKDNTSPSATPAPTGAIVANAVLLAGMFIFMIIPLVMGLLYMQSISPTTPDQIYTQSLNQLNFSDHHYVAYGLPDTLQLISWSNSTVTSWGDNVQYNCSRLTYQYMDTFNDTYEDNLVLWYGDYGNHGYTHEKVTK